MKVNYVGYQFNAYGTAAKPYETGGIMSAKQMLTGIGWYEKGNGLLVPKEAYMQQFLEMKQKQPGAIFICTLWIPRMV